MLRKHKASHQEELTRTQKDHQEVKILLNKQKELFQNLKLEKLAADKRQESQAAKIFALERRLKESTNLMETSVAFPSTPQHHNTDAGTSTGSVNNTKDSNHQHSFDGGNAYTIPRLGGSKEKSGIVSTAKKCAICFKDSSGLMKKCECGRKDCKIRAHASCVRRIYVGNSFSSTSTPARVPVILCGSSISGNNKTPSSSTSNKGFPSMHQHAASITPHH
uniref:Uncharacterized protein n=1 Tax=Pseudo-nitzschia australis TaxID=44445 RepID=A0A7S4AA35_9STRA|mmetsp:Transcript_24964/g.54740  ORF Transcript_24964/g.54740 Transcript_24964/m.54740 type:complete len:220 (+) Transcript_24964:146-805(+)